MSHDDPQTEATGSGDHAPSGNGGLRPKAGFGQIFKQAAIDSWQTWTSPWFWLVLPAAGIHALLYRILFDKSTANNLLLTVTIAAIFSGVILQFIGKPPPEENAFSRFARLRDFRPWILPALLFTYLFLLAWLISGLDSALSDGGGIGAELAVAFILIIPLSSYLIPNAFVAASRLGSTSFRPRLLLVKDLLLPRFGLFLITLIAIAAFIGLAIITSMILPKRSVIDGAVTTVELLFVFVPVLAAARRYALAPDDVAPLIDRYSSSVRPAGASFGDAAKWLKSPVAAWGVAGLLAVAFGLNYLSDGEEAPGTNSAKMSGGDSTGKCAVIKAFDNSAPQWFSDLRGEVTDKTDAQTIYESRKEFPKDRTLIKEYADGNTHGEISIGMGAASYEKVRNSYDRTVTLVKTCLDSKIINSKQITKNNRLSTTYMLSNNACVQIYGLSLFGSKEIVINFSTPDSSNKKCDALR